MIHVTEPVEGKGKLVNGAIIGESKKTQAWIPDADDTQIFYVREEAKEMERTRKYAESVFNSLQLQSFPLKDAKKSDFLQLFIRNESSLRKVMYDKKLKKYNAHTNDSLAA